VRLLFVFIKNNAEMKVLLSFYTKTLRKEKIYQNLMKKISQALAKSVKMVYNIYVLLIL